MRLYGFSLFLLIANLVYVIDGKHDMDEVIPYNDEKKVCADVKMDIADQKSKTICKPRMVIVKLRPEPGYIYFPDVVSVNRCHGYCYNHISCMPTVTNQTSVVVKRQYINSSVMTCHKVMIKEHVECKCLCNVMKEHCKANQIYMKNECACKCKDMEAKRKCDNMPNRKWNPETCSCMCRKEEEECSTGLSWVPEHCKCLSVTNLGHSD